MGKLLVLKEGTSFYETLHYLMASLLVVAIPQKKTTLGIRNVLRDVAPRDHWVAHCFQERFLMELHIQVTKAVITESLKHLCPYSWPFFHCFYLLCFLLLYICGWKASQWPNFFCCCLITGILGTLQVHLTVIPCLSTVDPWWLNLTAGDIWHH